MISTLLSFFGKFGLDAVLDKGLGFWEAKQAREHEARMTEIALESSGLEVEKTLDLAAMDAETERTDKRPKSIVWLQAVFGGLGIAYLGAMVLASLEITGTKWLTVHALPEPWSLLILFGTAALIAGPEVLQILKRRG